MNEKNDSIYVGDKTRVCIDIQTDSDSSSLSYLLDSINSLTAEQQMPNQCLPTLSKMKEVVTQLMDNKKLGNAQERTFLTHSIQTTTKNPRNEEFVNKLMRLIEDHMTEEKLDIEFMTRHFNMSHSTFYRKVKELTGYTAVDFIRRMKLRRGIELLQTRAYRISEVCYMTGFNSPAHFRQACKDEYNLTPTQILKDAQPAGYSLPN